MSIYKVEVKFRDCKTPFIMWRLEAVSMDFLIGDVVEKLRAWMGASSMFLKRRNEYRYSMMLVTVELGTVEISIVVPDDGES